MNNTFAFNNVEEFKDLFGFREVNGQLVRKNKIVLGFLRDWDCHKFIRDNMSPVWSSAFFKCDDVASLYNMCMNRLQVYSSGGNCIHIGDLFIYTNDYKMDVMAGLCEDGDYTAIRYINCSNGRVFKMKAGRFLKKLIDANEFGRHIPDSTVKYLCEEFSRRWETYAKSMVSDLELVVDEDFESIYDGHKCVGDFGSCMTNREYHSFYNNAVKAKAASLRRKDGKIVARCVIFTEVRDTDTGDVYRLAERQYSTDCDELLKRQLVDALIRGGYIDGYKAVGAGCHDSRNFVANDGSSMRDRRFDIDCHLENGDTLSYQDSFKNYDYDEQLADNYGEGPDELDTTDGQYNGGEGNEYDEYHECYCEDVVEVLYNGRYITCDAERLDDFYYIGGEYYHEDDVVFCPECDEAFLPDEGYYSELTEEDYCCESCRDRAEQEYKEENWTYAEIDDEYFEDKDDVTSVFIWSDWCCKYIEKTISQDRLDLGIGTDYHEYEGDYYDTLEHIDAA